jgi:hypothetical protein
MASKGGADKGEKKKEPKKAKMDEWEGDDEERDDEPLFEEVRTLAATLFVFFSFSRANGKQGAPEGDVPAFLAGGALRAKQVWARPPVSEALAQCQTALVFQTMEVRRLVPLSCGPPHTHVTGACSTRSLCKDQCAVGSHLRTLLALRPTSSVCILSVALLSSRALEHSAIALHLNTRLLLNRFTLRFCVSLSSPEVRPRRWTTRTGRRWRGCRATRWARCRCSAFLASRATATRSSATSTAFSPISGFPRPPISRCTPACHVAFSFSSLFSFFACVLVIAAFLFIAVESCDVTVLCFLL